MKFNYISNMKAENLRLGNLVTTTQRDLRCVYKVIAIGEEFVDLYCINSCDPFKEVNGVELPSVIPIELSEDWLLKFGFQKGAYDIFWLTENDLDLDLAETPEGWRVSSLNINPPIDYVHQLQNLYFSLTGTELTIK